MITITGERLPKIYERVVLEEYYRFFRRLENTGAFERFFHRPFKFTTDKDKQDSNDLKFAIFRECINTYESIDEANIEFVCLSRMAPISGKDDILFDDIDRLESISSIARIKVDNDNIHIAEILFLDYPTDEEQVKRIKRILQAVEAYGIGLDTKTVSCEIPKFDGQYLKCALDCDFQQVAEPARDRENAKTYLLEKSVTRERENKRRLRMRTSEN